jgi:GLPGLI family protein
MKKLKLLTFILFLLFAWHPVDSLQAQMTSEGMVQYLVTHNWVKKMTALTFLTKQQKDKQAYIWGNRSEQKMYGNLYFTATASKYEDSEEKAERDVETWNRRKETFFIKRDFDKGTIQEAYEMNGKTYIVEDSLYNMDWKIQNDLKEVAGHICMKAFTADTIKQLKITAWFAQDIPLSTGPERFYGLPGLILEVDINDGAMVMTANRIDYKKLSTELDPPKKLKGKKIKQAEYTALVKKEIDEWTKAELPWFWNLRY